MKVSILPKPKNFIQDLDFNRNAFNQKGNSDYRYQATDIRLIQAEIMKHYLDSFIIHEPIGDNSVIDQTLRMLITSLNKNKPTLCIYNLGNWHWVVFAALKIQDKIYILYKDSQGAKNEELEKQIKEISGAAIFIVNKEKEQPKGLECGIFALRNMEVMARCIKQNKEDFIKRFEDFKEFCNLFHAKELRAGEFAQKYVLGKYQEMVKESIKLSKLQKLREQHSEEVQEIRLKLKEVEFFRAFTIKVLAANEQLGKTEDTIAIEIATTNPDADLNNADYTYGYRISLSNNLSARAVEILHNISEVLSVDLSGVKGIVITLLADNVGLISKVPKKSIQDYTQPSISIAALSDNLSIGDNVSLQRDVELILTVEAEILDQLDPNIKYIIYQYLSNISFKETYNHKQNNKSLERKYVLEGDDSSDEELEQEIYQKPLNAGHYASLDMRVKGAKLFKHNITPIKTADQETIEEIIIEVEKVNGFLTPKKKISHDTKIKAKVKKTLDSLEDSPAKKAVQDAYEESKSKDSTDLRTLAIKKFLGGSKAEILPDTQTNSDNVPLLDLRWSLIFQDLGMRLFISNPVRALYFSNKEKFGKFDNLPTDEVILKCLENAVRKTLEKYKKLIPSVLEHESYVTLVNMILEDKRQVFALLNSNSSLYASLDKLLKVMNEQIVDQQHSPSVLLEIGARRIESIISDLQKIKGFITNTKIVSIAAKIKNEVIAQLKKITTFDHLYIEVVEEAYVGLESNKKISDLITLAKEKLAKKQSEVQKEEELDYGLDLMPNLQDEIVKLKEILLRPVLPDSTSFSSKDITPDGEYSGSETLFCYLRLIHCSAKRFIKNAKLVKDFDGVDFARGWQFDTGGKLSVIETQSLSSSNSMTSMVLYPHQSSYSYLLTKLQDFQQKANITSDDIVNSMKSILKNGKLPDALSISPPFERFLTILTYHLFGTEVERHPAAAIHNIMALDLVKTKGFIWVFKHLPMAIEDATSVARGIQTTLHKNLSIPYYYDSSANAVGPETEAFQEFITREQKLVLSWLGSRNLAVELNQDALIQIDNLCFDYYGIRLTGKIENEQE